MSYKVSVVIATYNTGKYIEECLNSILNQTLDSIEIVVIDDGSTDNTQGIISKYCAHHNNIMYFYQDNKGTGNARNKGIELASGDYLIFMDPDDFYHNNFCLKVMYDTIQANNVKMCGGNILSKSDKGMGYRYIAGDGIITRKKNCIVSVDEYIYLYGHTRFMYETSFIKSNNIRYAPYVRFEDQVFLMHALGLARKIYELDYPLYVYRIIEKELQKNENVCWDVFRGYRDTLEVLLKYKLDMMLVYNLPFFVEDIMNRLIQNRECRCEKYYKIMDDINQLFIESGWEDRKVFVSREYIVDYLNRIDEKERLVNNIFTNHKVILYGAGNNTRKFLSIYKDEIKNLVGIAISGEVTEEKYDGIPVKNISEYIDFNKDAYVIITPMQAALPEIERTLEKYGFKNHIWVDVRSSEKGLLL